jgi:hypothetical protein
MTDFEHEQEDEHEHEKRISQRPLAQLPRFLESILISCGLADAFSDYFGSIA